MENAVRALEYAFAVLIFIIGLSASIYLLSEVKTTSDIVFSRVDTPMKIERAKEIMDQNHDARIADIAIALGFSNVYYFSKVFRKVEGVPPTEYLKRS